MLPVHLLLGNRNVFRRRDIEAYLFGPLLLQNYFISGICFYFYLNELLKTAKMGHHDRSDQAFQAVLCSPSITTLSQFPWYALIYSYLNDYVWDLRRLWSIKLAY